MGMRGTRQCPATRFAVCTQEWRRRHGAAHLLRFAVSINLPDSVTASGSSTWACAGFSTKARLRHCGGARHPGQLKPIDEVFGWWLDAAAKTEIDRIMRASITDPVGPKFMAPPPRSNDAVLEAVQWCPAR